MLEARYLSDGIICNVIRCSIADICNHIGYVCQFWFDEDMQIDAMKRAVDTGTAWKITTSDCDVCFLYAIPYGRNLCGMSFWCKLKRYATIGYLFIKLHTRWRMIYWNPYRFRDIVPLKFLLDNQSITDYHNRNEFIGFRIPNPKLESLCRFEFRKHNIHEVSIYGW